MRLFPPLVASFSLLSLPAAAQISLVLDRTWDWQTDVPIAGPGGLEVDPVDGNLWLVDSGNGSDTYELNPQDFSVLGMLPPGIAPGMNAGPDSVAIDPMTGDLHLFAVFTETVGAVVTQSGTFLRSFVPERQPAGAAFTPDGRLFTTTDSGSLDLIELDPATHAVVSTTPISGVTGRVTALTFDPVSGDCYVLSSSGHVLHRLDLATGVSLDSQALVPPNAFGSFPGGIAFSANGAEFYAIDGSRGSSTLRLVAYRVDRGGTNYCGSVANSTGVGAVMQLTGSNVVAQNAASLGCTSLPTNAAAFFLSSRDQGFTANPSGSQGNLCLGGAIGRFVGPGQVLNSGASGTIQLALDLTQMPQPTGFVTVVAGDTWNFQAWYRDAVGGSATSNFSDGLEVLFL